MTSGLFSLNCDPEPCSWMVRIPLVLSCSVLNWRARFRKVTAAAEPNHLSIRFSCSRSWGSDDQHAFGRAHRVPQQRSVLFHEVPRAVSFALVGVVLSEFVGSPTGMGYMIISALAALNATNMFAAIAILRLAGLVLVYSVQSVERRVLHWSTEFREET